MKQETILEVLMCLFDYYMIEDAWDDFDRLELHEKLSDAGLTHTQINNVFIWLDHLRHPTSDFKMTPPHNTMRVYTDEECEILDKEARGLLLFLEQVGVLNMISREFIIEKAMTSDEPFIDAPTLKWIIFQVFAKLPSQSKLFAWMATWVHTHAEGLYH